ncbi:MAG: EAL domain-containing protein [Beijerinckiaceae bacterium]|nr:EAL domain-containing protein [Beijerinckiaceae bacterium]
MSIVPAVSPRRVGRKTTASAGLAVAPALDVASILGALGEVVYRWDIDTDRLVWGGDIERLLVVHRPLTTGSSFQRMVSERGGPIRYDEMLRHASQDTMPRLSNESTGGLLADGAPSLESGGRGMAYRFSYRIALAPGRAVTVEESGRYLGGAGQPRLAYGVLRVIEAPVALEVASLEAAGGRLLSREALASRLDAVLQAGSKRVVRAKDGTPLPARPRARGASSTGFLLAGLSDLGHLNRTYGFDVADEVIALVAERLRGALRLGDEIGRYSGNKLGIILTDCTDERLSQAAERFLSVIRDHEFGTRHGSIKTSIKLGAVLAAHATPSASEMMQNAEDALAEAKKHPQSSFVCFAADQRREEQRRVNQRTSDDLIAALNDRRVMLAYQPIACARSRTVRYHEGLVRMQGLDGCVRGAAQIVPPAERVGLLKHIDMRVIQLAVAELARSRTSVLSINVDGPSMIDGEWLQMLAGTLLSHRIEAGRLIIEITETAMIEDFAATSEVIRQMHGMGVRVALDDFGAGHTSFRTLRNIPIDIVKIDGVFMHDLAGSKDDRFFVKTLIDLARHLEMKTVAEWVRDEETADILTDLGIDYLQGDFIGEALLSPVSGYPVPALVPDCLDTAAGPALRRLA